MLSDGECTYTYDAMNRLTEVTTADGNRQRNIYDAEGLRAEMEENDGLVTDETGNICNRYEYDAFGDIIVREETVQNRFAYAGEDKEEVGGEILLYENGNKGFDV